MLVIWKGSNIFLSWNVLWTLVQKTMPFCCAPVLGSWLISIQAWQINLSSSCVYEPVRMLFLFFCASALWVSSLMNNGSPLISTSLLLLHHHHLRNRCHRLRATSHHGCSQHGRRPLHRQRTGRGHPDFGSPRGRRHVRAQPRRSRSPSTGCRRGRRPVPLVLAFRQTTRGGPAWCP